MSTIWFTSDTHYWHKNIIEYSNRPYASIETMNADLVKQYNNCVTNADTVYFLGDVNVGNNDGAIEILENLNGKKILIKGNHDSNKIRNWIGWDATYDYFELTVKKSLYVLCHYPFQQWNGCHRGTYHLHGHTHGSIKQNGKRLDIGVDCKIITEDYRPVSIDEVFDYLIQQSNTPH